MVSGKFAITVHILTLLSEFPGEYLSSEYIANSINVHPVLVRKEIVNLKNNNVVESKEGKNGGTRLALPSSKISLDTIFKITLEHLSLGYSKNDPNPSCAVGKKINEKLDKLYAEINEKVSAELKAISVKDFAEKF